MVEIKSPINIKDIEGKLGISFKRIVGKGGRRELFDTDKLITLKLKKGEAIVLIDTENRIWELRRRRRLKFNWRQLNLITF